MGIGLPHWYSTDYGRTHVILCQITTQAARDRYAVSLTDSDFTMGSLRQNSHIRPNRLFTADAAIILYRVGVISSTKQSEVTAKIVEILNT